MGQTVALSGAKSGLVVSTIRSTKFWDERDRRLFRPDVDKYLRGWRLGCPWLTTMGPNDAYPGDVIAHGQHRGAVTSGAYQGCVWVPVTYISSNVQASLLLP